MDGRMTAKKDKDALKEVHRQALARADEAWAFERDNIEAGREDQRFYAGEQWDEAAKKARGTDRPMLTVNRLPAFVRQMTGDVRQNPPSIKVLPAKGDASQEVADIENGLIRNIEAQSDASAVYCIAAENAAIAGQGAFRIVTDYSNDDGFELDIRIKPIRDPFGVLLDPMAQLPDKSDIGWGFVFERVSKEQYKADWPDAAEVEFAVNPENGGQSFSWRVGESIRIAEYWRKVPEKRTLYMLEGGQVVSELPPGAKFIRTRQVDAMKVESYLMSGTEVLSGPHEWPGRYIPICMVAGEEITIDGGTKRKGMVRDAKDPQRLVNYARTTDAETTALQPKAPFIVTQDMIAGYESQWNTAGSKNHPYLVYKPDKMAPSAKPERSQPPVMSQALANLSLTAGQDLKDVTGIHDASLGARSNETSGRAILARQREGDTGTYLYPDNLRRAVAYAGRILVDLIPHIYDNERIVRVLHEDGSHKMVEINKPVQGEGGEWQKINDLSLGEYDVAVSTGKSFLTRRQEMADTLVQLSGNMPVIGEVAPDLVVKALDFPGGDEIAKRLERKLGPLVTSDAPPPPDPLMAAQALKAAADTDKTRAETEGLEIDNAGKMLALETGMQQIGQTLQNVEQLIAQMMAMQKPAGAPEGQGGPMPGGPPPGGPAPGMPAMDIPPPQPNPELTPAELEPMTAG